MYSDYAMFSFFSEFTRDVDAPSTIIVMDAEGYEQPRHYSIVPRRVLFFGICFAACLSIVMLFVIVVSPLKEFIPGYGTAEMRQSARLNALRVVALQDSLQAQGQYAEQLRNLMLGQIDTTSATTIFAQDAGSAGPGAEEPADGEPSTDWADHRQPAISLERMGAVREMPFRSANVSSRNLSSVLLPALTPVDGFITRTFDARTGHYAVDIAVEEGTIVRSIGDGYVIFSDWTQEGGYAIVVQHSDGYVTVYKHNQRLLKRIGDRVRARDEIAVSGNSGEISTGPHLHFELWHDGLAQDPRNYFVGD